MTTTTTTTTRSWASHLPRYDLFNVSLVAGRFFARCMKSKTEWIWVRAFNATFCVALKLSSFSNGRDCTIVLQLILKQPRSLFFHFYSAFGRNSRASCTLRKKGTSIIREEYRFRIFSRRRWWIFLLKRVTLGEMNIHNSLASRRQRYCEKGSWIIVAVNSTNGKIFFKPLSAGE